MTMNEAEILGLSDAISEPAALRGWSDWRRLVTAPPLIVRYGLVSGALGVPLSIAQLTVMLWIYGTFVGDYGLLVLNGLWLLNFELGLLRNFGLHCAYTWRLKPTWHRLRHAHVAAVGAVIIDLIAFNGVVLLTGIIPLAQVAGASSGFVFNFGYNRLKTFRGEQTTMEGVAV